MSFFPPPSKPVPDGHPLEPIDAHGSPIRAGDLVLIPVIPEWLTHDLPPEDVSRLKAQESTTMRILEIDSYGYLWFGEGERWFSLRPSEVELQRGGTNGI